MLVDDDGEDVCRQCHGIWLGAAVVATGMIRVLTEFTMRVQLRSWVRKSWAQTRAFVTFACCVCWGSSAVSFIARTTSCVYATATVALSL